MYMTLELGMAGTNEWLAASQNMSISEDSFSGLTCYNGQMEVAIDLFSVPHFEVVPGSVAHPTLPFPSASR
jgi:hypothetical protein